jgi:hypothetical protein
MSKAQRSTFKEIEECAYGNAPCFKALVKIVNELGSRKYSCKAATTLTEFRTIANKLESIGDVTLRIIAFTAIFKERRAVLNQGPANYDEHLKCCLSAIHKIYLRKWLPRIFKTTKWPSDIK